jgi:alkylation response protein AidB-like acyl-CoA dehydrogenase
MTSAPTGLDHAELHDAVDRVLREHRDEGDVARVWRALGEVGALGLRVPAAWGGLGESSLLLPIGTSLAPLDRARWPAGRIQRR